MELQLTNYKVTLLDEMDWGADALIEAEMVSALEVNAEQRDQINKQANEANKAGKPIGSDPFMLKGMSMNGKAILAAKVKSAELIIEKIVDNNGKEVKFTREWLYGLPRKDGRKLMKEVENIRHDNEDPISIAESIEGK